VGRVAPLRVLHVPDAVGGNPPGLARAERELGLESVSVVFAQSPFGYAVDEVLRPPGTGRLRYAARRARLLVRALRDFDVVHFNFGGSLLPAPLAHRELPMLRAAGKVVAVTFQGDDVRRGEGAPSWPSLQAELPDRYRREVDDERRRRIEAFARHADLMWYLNPDLADVLPPHARFLAYAHVDPREWRPRPRSDRKRPIVVHAPSDRPAKGTSHVLAAVDELRRRGIDVELNLLEDLPHDAVSDRLAGADVAVDQLLAGWYGGFAVEAMALGLPVVAYIRESDLVRIDPSMRSALPVLSATPDTLAEVLAGLLSSSEARATAGDASRTYVERWHDPRTVAAKTAAAYADARAAISR
jgi:glycosyltransferase involved in cell wall biosynthesis